MIVAVGGVYGDRGNFYASHPVHCPLEVYHIDRDVWQSVKCEMPVLKWPGACVFGDFVFIVGGKYTEGHNHRISNGSFLVNIKNGQVSCRQSPVTPRFNSSMYYVDGKAILFGGEDDKYRLAPCVELYDFGTDTWSEIALIPVNLSYQYISTSYMTDTQEIHYLMEEHDGPTSESYVLKVASFDLEKREFSSSITLPHPQAILASRWCSLVFPQEFFAAPSGDSVGFGSPAPTNLNSMVLGESINSINDADSDEGSDIRGRLLPRSLCSEDISEKFRVLIPQCKTGIQEKKRRPRRNAVPRYMSMHIDQDWTAVWPNRAMFKASAVPLPLRQGLVTCMLENNGIIPAKYGNTELMKIPNFLHLTPSHIKQHCNVIKVMCTKFPDELKDPKIQRQYLPLEITTKDYVFSSCDIRDERARVVQFKFPIESLMLDKPSADKFRRLVGNERICPNDVVTIVADRCPRRVQNLDYAHYLMAALYLESQVREKWEKEKHYTDWEQYEWDKSPAKAKLDLMMDQLKRPASAQKKLKEEYKQAITALYDKKTELKDDLLRYGAAVEKLYRLNEVKTR